MKAKSTHPPAASPFLRMLFVGVIFALMASACGGSAPEPTQAAPTDLPAPPSPTNTLPPAPTETEPAAMATEAPGLSLGQWVLFTSVTDTSRAVYSVNRDDLKMTQITPGTSMNWDADLSRDGSKFVFVSAMDGNPEIYSMNLDGSELTRLTFDPAADYAPVWSPDGSMIAFVTDRNGNADIYAMSADGKETVQVTTSPAHDYYPSWGPDSTEIAFVSESDGDAEIYIFNTNGSISQVTQNTFYDADPAWSPNGRFIVYSAAPEDTQADIFMIRPDGTDLQQVTYGPANDIQPNWSWDSNYILFASNRDSATMEIYLMEESGATTRLTFNEVDDRFPSWGPLVDEYTSIPGSPGNTPLSPTAVALPTQAPPPAPTNASTSACDIDQVMLNLQELMGYDFVFAYGGGFVPGVGNVLTLSFWFIDYRVNSQPGDNATTTMNNSGTALETALWAVSFMEHNEPCVDELFASINPIVVDENYNGWISFNIAPGVLPEEVDLNDPATKDIMDEHVTLGYVRDTAPAAVPAPPTQYCQWDIIRDSLEIQFFPISNGNTSFFLVRDSNGTNVWAYLDNDNVISDPNYLGTYTLMIIQEVACLSPDNLILHVVGDGEILFAGRLPREGIENMDVSQFVTFP